MAMIDPILDELARESETTKKVLARVPTDKLSWKPHEKARTLGDLAWHVASIPVRIATLAQLEDADVLAHKQAPRPDTAEEILGQFTASLGEAREKLSRLTDDELGKKVHFHRGKITMARLPKIAFLRTVMLNHWYHHRGQLSVYLRLLDIPVPSIYGPTADES
jgi:uncharacterized damage-inducible protein DinB